MLARLQEWWAKVRLVGGPGFGGGGASFKRTLCYPELADQVQRSKPLLQPYEGLAECWNGYARHYQSNYGAFLDHLARAGRLDLKSVLDLGCGVGMLTVKLADLVHEVVGLDASESMLARARAGCAEKPNVTFVCADFRSFQLPQSFDAVVCGFNSINYVADLGELAKVFKTVAEHLQPDGIFVFDTLTGIGMKLLSGLYAHVETAGKRFAIHFSYDRQTRKERAVVLVPAGTEIHERIAINPKDVEQACSGSGLLVEDYFSSAFAPGHWFTGPCCYFVLRKPSS